MHIINIFFIMIRMLCRLHNFKMLLRFCFFYCNIIFFRENVCLQQPCFVLFFSCVIAKLSACNLCMGLLALLGSQLLSSNDLLYNNADEYGKKCKTHHNYKSPLGVGPSSVSLKIQKKVKISKNKEMAGNLNLPVERRWYHQKLVFWLVLNCQFRQ